MAAEMFKLKSFADLYVKVVLLDKFTMKLLPGVDLTRASHTVMVFHGTRWTWRGLR